MEDLLRKRIIGRSMRLGTYHADLRGKHVIVDERGWFRAALDWGASETRFFPLVDLLQLVVHQRKQESGSSFGEAWRSVRSESSWRPYERDTFRAYAEGAHLDRSDISAFLGAFPLFVAGMAERNWDFSRPHWVEQQFGLD